MLQASILDCFAFGPFAAVEDGLSAPEVNIGGRQITQAFVVSMVVIVLDEAADVRFEIAGQVIVFEQDAVLQRLVPAFDLALRLRMVRRSPYMLHVGFFKPFRQIAGDITRSVVAEQARLVSHTH